MRQRYFLTKNISSISFPNTFKDDCTDEIVFIYIDYALLKSLNCNAYVRLVAFDTVKIWDKNSSNQLRSLTGHSDEVYAVAFDSNHMLASGSNDKTIKLWNKNSGVLSRTLTGHGKLVYIVTFDFTYLLASVSWDDTIKIWNKNSEDLL